MVGASSNPDKASHGIMQKLQSVGYRVIPVNPKETEILGERAYPSLRDIDQPVDIVDVFRRVGRHAGDCGRSGEDRRKGAVAADRRVERGRRRPRSTPPGCGGDGHLHRRDARDALQCLGRTDEPTVRRSLATPVPACSGPAGERFARHDSPSR